MKIVFFGSAQFAVPTLEALIKSRHEVLCVVTQPDKQKGRHLRLSATLVKSAAQSAKLKIFQPQNINSKESVNFLKSLGADIFVIVAYGQIFSQEVLDIPKIMPVNTHASLLPRYRGAAPINWAIINGDKISGVTIMRVVLKMDAGEIISRKEIKIEKDDTAITLEEKLRFCAAELLMEALEAIDQRAYSLIEQDEDKVVLAPKIDRQAGQIDWNASAVNIHNQIRGVLPWPGAHTNYRRKTLKIFQADVLPVFCNHKPAPGEIVRLDKQQFVVACARGFLAIKELQLEGRKRMGAREFIIGQKLSAGESLGK